MAEVLVTENIVGEAMDQLKNSAVVHIDTQLWKDPERLRLLLGDVRALVVRNQTQVDAQLLAAAPRLEVIGRAGAGLDNVDTQAATNAGVVVCYTPRANSVSVAELTMGLILALARKLPAAHEDTRNGGWHRQRFTGCELQGKTLGIVGLGQIGELISLRAAAFGMTVVASDRYVDPSSERVAQLPVEMVEWDQLLDQADLVSCHVPLTDETRDMFGYGEFCRMKHSAAFINTSRGEVVDEKGLARALEEGQISGAALDVRRSEPPACDALERMDNVILTPHIAAFTQEAQERVVATVCQDVRNVLAGRPAESYFNFDQPRRGRT